MLEIEKIDSLYKDLKNELFVYIYRFINSYELSEDILHDCFINLIKYSMKNEVNEKSIRAFLYRTAHNLCINFLKRNSKFSFSDIEETNISKYSSSYDNVEAEIEVEELNSKIYKLLENIDEFSKSIFIMKKEMNLSFAQIAENTGISERTVRRKMKKLSVYLMDELKKTGFI